MVDNECYLYFKIQANSKQNQILGYWDKDIIKMRIAAPAVDNKANKEIIKFLSKLLSLKKNQVSIEKGEKSKIKKIFFFNVDKKKIYGKINKIINEL